MKAENKKALKLAVALTLLYIVLPMKTKATTAFSAVKSVLANFIMQNEGFRAKPYWDVKRWSWGYGTRVPGSLDDINITPQKTITKEQAFYDMQAHYNNDFNDLLPRLKVALNPNQWAAYLSFSYNLGIGNARNLLANINAGDNVALGIQWSKYILSGGVPNDELKARRAREWALWNKV